MIDQPTARFCRRRCRKRRCILNGLDCKHTEFDDLYPYMIEHPQFFWYKRYVAWSELLTIVKLCEQLQVAWHEQFTPQQVEYIQKRVMSAKVLDYWFETNDSREHVGG